VHDIAGTVAAFHLLGLKRPPWLVLGLVLLAALVSRSLMFLIAMLRHHKDD
jgi:hypothetical protein